MLTTVLDILGILLLAAFAFAVWPPAALLVLGVSSLLVSWRLAAPAGGDA